MPPTDPSVVVALDVANLAASCAFYALLGFHPTHTERQGLIFETCSLQSPAHPHVLLRLRAGFGRRPVGSAGGLLFLGLRLPQKALVGLAAALAGKARFYPESPPEPFAGDRFKVVDPDGYVVELYS